VLIRDFRCFKVPSQKRSTRIISPHNAVSTLPPASLLTGTFVSTSDTGGTYCVDLRVTNNTAVEQAWRATFAMNGTRITSTSNVTLDTTGNGIVRLLPNQTIPANTTQQGIFGFCASRTSGNALPSTPLIRTQY